MVAHVLQRTRLRRAPAVLLSAAAVWLVGIASVLSFSLWARWRPLGFLAGFAQSTWFDVADYVSSNILLPIGAVLTSVLVGWRLKRAVVAEELAESPPLVRRACVVLLRTVCPIAILLVLLAKLIG